MKIDVSPSTHTTSSLIEWVDVWMCMLHIVDGSTHKHLSPIPNRVEFESFGKNPSKTISSMSLCGLWINWWCQSLFFWKVLLTYTHSIQLGTFLHPPIEILMYIWQCEGSYVPAVKVIFATEIWQSGLLLWNMCASIFPMEENQHRPNDGFEDVTNSISQRTREWMKGGKKKL